MSKSDARVVCIGAASIDRIFRCDDPLRMQTSNPARVEHGFGGAARNVAENLARLGATVTFCGVVGDDEAGHALVQHLQAVGCDVTGVRVVDGAATAQYAAIIAADGELAVGACDAGPLEALTVADLEDWMPLIAGALWLLLDCNLPAPVLAEAMRRRENAWWRLAIDGTSVAKALRLPKDLSAVDLLFVNEAEASTLGERGAKTRVISRGGHGILLRTGDRRVEIPARSVEAVVDVTGAGDALVAATLRTLIDGYPLEEALVRATELAALTVQSATAVP